MVSFGPRFFAIDSGRPSKRRCSARFSCGKFTQLVDIHGKAEIPEYLLAPASE